MKHDFLYSQVLSKSLVVSSNRIWYKSHLATYEQSRIPHTRLLQTRSALGEKRYFTTDTEAFDKQM